MALARAVLPPLYTAYMWLVWRTSRVDDRELPRVREVAAARGGVVTTVWHDEVFGVAWAYRSVRPHTLASVGDAGEVVTAILRRCGYVVFRGGSSRRKTRRRGEEVLADMIAHMRATPEVVYGITVDGSYGPRYRVKRGALVIARECGKPLLLVRTWARWNIRLPTWDRMAIPLPWNRIRQRVRGPYEVPPGADDPAVFEAFRARIESDMVALAEECGRRER